MASEKCLEMRIRYWWKDGEVAINGIDHNGEVMWSSVSGRPESKRYHANLYRKLVERLQTAGKVPAEEQPDSAD